MDIVASKKEKLVPNWKRVLVSCIWFIIYFNVHAAKASSIHLQVVVTVPYEKPYLFRKELVKPAIKFAIHAFENKALHGNELFDFHVTYQ